MFLSKNQQRKLARRQKGQLRAAQAELAMWKDMNKRLLKVVGVQEAGLRAHRQEIRKFEKGLLTPDGLHLPPWVQPPCPVYFRLDDQKYDSSKQNGLIILPK